MRKYSISYVYWIEERNDYDSKQIGESDSIQECIKLAETFAKLNPYLKSFEWETFEDIAYHFTLNEWEYENIEGFKVPGIIVQCNVEEIYQDYLNDPELKDLSKYTNYN